MNPIITIPNEICLDRYRNPPLWDGPQNRVLSAKKDYAYALSRINETSPDDIAVSYAYRAMMDEDIAGCMIRNGTSYVGEVWPKLPEGLLVHEVIMDRAYAWVEQQRRRLGFPPSCSYAVPKEYRGGLLRCGDAVSQNPHRNGLCEHHRLDVVAFWKGKLAAQVSTLESIQKNILESKDRIQRYGGDGDENSECQDNTIS